ncbi:methylglyoxal synthase [Chroogloeocystis siderophila]|jgi:diacylglycerol kinase (ATP)|uniref:methylglyoxal synthase n=1 Tax=Chroogloeocystis siderophila TaxID=329163 RepID=UPI001C4A70D4|nr:hypothetical protein [Chroogloeocystis siderophila]
MLPLLIMANTIALITHDSRKEDIVQFALAHASILSRYHLIASVKTSAQIQAATELPVEQKLTGSRGGVVQIAAEVASGNVLAVIFFSRSADWLRTKFRCLVASL